MAGLMVIFLFIAISYMIKVQKQFEAFVYLKKEYLEAQEAIYKELQGEFEEDLAEWDAEIDRKTLAVIFHEPNTLFVRGKADLLPRYKEILKDFFPRYIKAIMRTKQKKYISKVRIEGHASPGWKKNTPPKTAFINNMALSQLRSSSVLRFVLEEINVGADFNWVKQHLISVGYSSTEPVINTLSQTVDNELSRRVEFRIVMNAQELLFEIISGEMPDDYQNIKISPKEKEEMLHLLEKKTDFELKLRKN